MRHPFTLAFALAFSAYLCQHLRDVEGTRDYANRTMAISSEHGFLFWKQQATMLRGWALAELGHVDDGLNQIRAGLDAYEAMKSGLAAPWFRSLLAHAYVKAGRPDAALRALDDALLREKNGRRGFTWRKYTVFRAKSHSHTGVGKRPLKRRLVILALSKFAASRKPYPGNSERPSVWRAFGETLANTRMAAGLACPNLSKFKEGFDTPDIKEAIQIMRELEAHGQSNTRQMRLGYNE